MSEQLLTAGSILTGRYRIQDYIGAGGMQEVYRTYDESFSRLVVVKTPKNESAQKRFDRSARMSARVNHANVANTLDYFEEEGRAFLVEEWIDGEDLGRVVVRQMGRLDPHLLAFLLHRLSKGVAAAHHAGVFHRDLKPSNIMVSKDAGLAIVKITDFGISRLAKQELEEAIEQGEASISSSQTALGALPYMAPEMIDRPREASTPADIWAVGAIAYRLLTGALPFGKGLRAVNAITAAVLPAPPAWFGRNPQFADLEAELWEIIKACLAKGEADRPTGDRLIELCSNLCYSSAPRKFGRVESLRPGNGSWGHIEADDGSRTFYHEDSVYGTGLSQGALVSFARFPGSPYPRAFPVLVLSPGDALF